MVIVVKVSNTGRSTNVGLMLGHRLRRWPNIKPTLVHCLYLLLIVAYNHSQIPLSQRCTLRLATTIVKKTRCCVTGDMKDKYTEHPKSEPYISLWTRILTRAVLKSPNNVEIIRSENIKNSLVLDSFDCLYFIGLRQL